RPCRRRRRRRAAGGRTCPRCAGAYGRYRRGLLSCRLSQLESQVGLADADDVAWRELARPLDAGSVHVCAVRRPHVGHPYPISPRVKACVLRGGELVTFELDVVLLTASH